MKRIILVLSLAATMINTTKPEYSNECEQELANDMQQHLNMFRLGMELYHGESYCDSLDERKRCKKTNRLCKSLEQDTTERASLLLEYEDVLNCRPRERREQLSHFRSQLTEIFEKNCKDPRTHYSTPACETLSKAIKEWSKEKPVDVTQKPCQEIPSIIFDHILQ